MDVAVVGSLGAEQSGPHQVTLGLAQGYDRLGHSVQILAHGDSPVREYQGVPVVDIGPRIDSVRELYDLSDRVVNRADDYNLVHASNGLARPVDICTVQWAGTGLDLLRDGQYDGSVNLPRLSGETSRVGARLDWIDDHELVVAQSHLTARQMQEYWQCQPDGVIPLGVSRSRLSPPTTPTRPLDVVLPGRVSPKKGQHRVLEHLDDSPDEISIEVVGRVSDAAELTDTDVPGQLRGYLPSEEYYKTLSQSDISIIPSYHENFSLTAIESMACGSIVIITDSCGIAHDEKVATLPGVVVVENGSAAARKLRRLASEPVEKLFDYKKSCFDFASRNTWSAVVEQYLRAYHDCSTLEGRHGI